MTSEKTFTATHRDIFPLLGPVQCGWCKEEIGSLGAHITAKQVFLCDDCADLAKEVGDGTLTISTGVYDGRTYTVDPPLILTLVVRYTESGYRWLSAKAPRGDSLGRLICDEHGGGVSGTTRDEILLHVADHLASPEAWIYAREDAAESKSDLRLLRAMERRITIVERVEEVRDAGAE